MNQFPQQLIKGDITKSQKILPTMVNGKRINDSNEHQKIKGKKTRAPNKLNGKKDHKKPELCEFAMLCRYQSQLPSNSPEKIPAIFSRCNANALERNN